MMYVGPSEWRTGNCHAVALQRRIRCGRTHDISTFLTFRISSAYVCAEKLIPMRRLTDGSK